MPIEHNQCHSLFTFPDSRINPLHFFFSALISTAILKNLFKHTLTSPVHAVHRFAPEMIRYSPL